MNNSSSDSAFKVYANLPANDLMICDKVSDLMELCEVEFLTTVTSNHGNRKDFASDPAQL